jgi:hypothetical protein
MTVEGEGSWFATMYLILLSTATTPIFVNLSSVTNSLSNVFFQATGRVDMERALEVLGMEMINTCKCEIMKKKS